MKYLMLICVDESVGLSPEAVADVQAATEAWVTEMDGSRMRLMGGRLQPVRDATTVRMRDADVLVADGPFAETREQIAGFDIIECADLDQAIDVAVEHPAARFGTIEVRPFWQ